MHIILDSNVYSSDYRMSGVSFRTLFDYLRRTESRLVLPRAIREEVVYKYGRRLKTTSKQFAEVFNRYRHLDLNITAPFQKPDIQSEMKRLRKMLMKPQQNVTPVYLRDIEGVSVNDVFLCGVHRKRPANEEGEELRDVIIWLWALEYSRSSGEEVAFVSDDSGFWSGDGTHPQIQKDISDAKAKVVLYRSIDDFIKKHAPAPIPATTDWVNENVPIDSLKPSLYELAKKELNSQASGKVSGIVIEHLALAQGNVFEIDSETRFAELEFRLNLKFEYKRSRFPEPWTPQSLERSRKAFYGELVPGSTFMGLTAEDLPNLRALMMIPEVETKQIDVSARAQVSVRIKSGGPTELSISSFAIDHWARF